MNIKTIERYSNKTKKLVKKVNIIPYPAFLEENKKELKELLTTNKRIITFLDFYRVVLFSVNTNKNIEFKNILLSKNYLFKHIRFLTTKKHHIQLREILLYTIHKGNSLDKLGASAYSSKLEEFLLSKDENKKAKTSYSKERKIIKLIKDFLNDEITYKEVNEFYNDKKIKVKLEPIEISNIKSEQVAFKNKHAKTKPTVSTIEKIYLNQEILLTIEEKIMSYNKLLENKIMYSKKIVHGLSLLEKMVDNINKNDFSLSLQMNTSISNGRIYNLITSLPGTVRKQIFNEHLHLDITNTAFVTLRNKYKNFNLPAFDYYINNRQKVIQELADKVYLRLYNIRINNKPLNRRKDKYIKIKGYLKINFLKIIFGSQLNSEFSRCNGEEERLVMGELRDGVFGKAMKRDVLTLIKINKKNKLDENLSNIFMKVETQIMTELECIFRKYNNDSDIFILRIHDEIIVDNKIYGFGIKKELKDLLKRYNIKIPGIRKVREDEDLKINNKKLLNNLYSAIYRLKETDLIDNLKFKTNKERIIIINNFKTNSDFLENILNEVLLLLELLDEKLISEINFSFKRENIQNHNIVNYIETSEEIIIITEEDRFWAEW